MDANAFFSASPPTQPPPTNNSVHQRQESSLSANDLFGSPAPIERWTPSNNNHISNTPASMFGKASSEEKEEDDDAVVDPSFKQTFPSDEKLEVEIGQVQGKEEQPVSSSSSYNDNNNTSSSDDDEDEDEDDDSDETATTDNIVMEIQPPTDNFQQQILARRSSLRHKTNPSITQPDSQQETKTEDPKPAKLALPPRRTYRQPSPRRKLDLPTPPRRTFTPVKPTSLTPSSSVGAGNVSSSPRFRVPPPLILPSSRQRLKAPTPVKQLARRHDVQHVFSEKKEEEDDEDECKALDNTREEKMDDVKEVSGVA